MAKKKAREPDLVDRLRAAVEAATTPAEFEAAREAIRRAMSPQSADRTDLPETCARKRRELGRD